MERTSTQFDAVYENGVLRPLNPVDLPEHERLSVIVNRPADALADVLDWDAHELAATEGDESISLEDVQAALSKIPGSMADVVSAERDDRYRIEYLLRRSRLLRCHAVWTGSNFPPDSH